MKMPMKLLGTVVLQGLMLITSISGRSHCTKPLSSAVTGPHVVMGKAHFIDEETEVLTVYMICQGLGHRTDHLKHFLSLL